MTTISVIVPVYNAEKWIEKCLQSVVIQSYKGPIEVSLYDDGSTDSTMNIVEMMKKRLDERDIVIITGGHQCAPRGVGYSKNAAIRQSTGKYLCFLDADDEMEENRIEKQLEAAKSSPGALIGCKFHREPADATARFTNWANSLSQSQLYTQAYTSHGPTVVMPTWFCSKEVFDRIGSFDEGGKGIPEDLIFFYKHLELGGKVLRIDEDLLLYRYHSDATTFLIKEETIWKLRVEFLEKQVLSQWNEFTIWNAGKQGRKLFRSLSNCNQKKVLMFCDVDEKKIEKGIYIHETSKEKIKPRIPIVHFTNAKPPIIICVKMDLTGGSFERNLDSLNLVEGRDFYHFN